MSDIRQISGSSRGRVQVDDNQISCFFDSRLQHAGNISSSSLFHLLKSSSFHLIFFLLSLQVINCAYTFQVFQGNLDKDTVVSHVFQQHIKARFVRILPQTWNVQIAMRVELYGCSYA